MLLVGSPLSLSFTTTLLLGIVALAAYGWNVMAQAVQGLWLRFLLRQKAANKRDEFIGQENPSEMPHRALEGPMSGLYLPGGVLDIEWAVRGLGRTGWNKFSTSSLVLSLIGVLYALLVSLLVPLGVWESSGCTGWLTKGLVEVPTAGHRLETSQSYIDSYAARRHAAGVPEDVLLKHVPLSSGWRYSSVDKSQDWSITCAAGRSYSLNGAIPTSVASGDARVSVGAPWIYEKLSLNQNETGSLYAIDTESYGYYQADGAGESLQRGAYIVGMQTRTLSGKAYKSTSEGLSQGFIADLYSIVSERSYYNPVTSKDNEARQGKHSAHVRTCTFKRMKVVGDINKAATTEGLLWIVPLGYVTYTLNKKGNDWEDWVRNLTGLDRSAASVAAEAVSLDRLFSYITALSVKDHIRKEQEYRWSGGCIAVDWWLVFLLGLGVVAIIATIVLEVGAYKCSDMDKLYGVLKLRRLLPVGVQDWAHSTAVAANPTIGGCAARMGTRKRRCVAQNTAFVLEKTEKTHHLGFTTRDDSRCHEHTGPCNEFEHTRPLTIDNVEYKVGLDKIVHDSVEYVK